MMRIALDIYNTESEDVTYKWWVLQDTGELLATFRWPGNRSIEKIKTVRLYARETEGINRTANGCEVSVRIFRPVKISPCDGQISDIHCSIPV